jgi:hypothetical protein
LVGTWLILLLLAGPAETGLQEEEPDLPISWSRFTLRNGLEDGPVEGRHAAPGLGGPGLPSRLDPGAAGKTGLAYLLENMMFLGSHNVGPMQHISYINRVGGETAANTTGDITYF